jgi:hypothetical protein
VKAWRIPQLWPGATVAILASGPSMSLAVADLVRAAGMPAIVINTTHRLAPWAAMLYAADIEWWQHPSNADAATFAGLRVSCQQVPGVLALRNAGTVGYSDEPDCVHTIGNSGAQALQIAIKAGAKRVLLCGFDMHGGHWHGVHPAGLRDTAPENYVTWVGRFEKVAPLLKARADIVNVTPGSALKCFRMSTLEEEIAACAEQAPRLAALPA